MDGRGKALRGRSCRYPSNVSGHFRKNNSPHRRAHAIVPKTSQTGWTSLHKQVLKRILNVRPWMDEPRTDLHGRTDFRDKPHRPPRGRKEKMGIPDRQANFLGLFTASGSIASILGSGGRTVPSFSGTCNLSIRKTSIKPSRFFEPRIPGEATCISGRHRRALGR